MVVQLAQPHWTYYRHGRITETRKPRVSRWTTGLFRIQRPYTQTFHQRPQEQPGNPVVPALWDIHRSKNTARGVAVGFTKMHCPPSLRSAAVSQSRQQPICNKIRTSPGTTLSRPSCSHRGSWGSACCCRSPAHHPLPPPEHGFSWFRLAKSRQAQAWPGLNRPALGLQQQRICSSLAPML